MSELDGEILGVLYHRWAADTIAVLRRERDEWQRRAIAADLLAGTCAGAEVALDDLRAEMERITRERDEAREAWYAACVRVEAAEHERDMLIMHLSRVERAYGEAEGRLATSQMAALAMSKTKTAAP